ncbi:RNA polymerase sigma factor [Pseudidiomarina donghaiensis]|uniref:RNA polymerase sigma factor n=1 Tax=Pseudidiomarina donghaiensis TaxID=519452 RepID=A0A432XDV6_9GAMM|nr:RNA polymerase sigma factor [Pseudidiomarina donghaiensis]RUO46737.1 RNA polymerase sigma factor [Pseudidiomarina donghaiensis]SFV24509.1 Sigma-70 region 2 [Pseudidiomarina donghaiensis]
MEHKRIGFGCALSPAIFNQAIRGKPQAQRVVFETFKPAVLRTLMGLCHDRELARDLAQDVFIQTFRKIHQIRKPEAFGGWLKKLTIRTALAEFRRQQPQTNSEPPDIADTSWHNMADWLTQLDDIERLINQLDTQERTLVWLYLGEGYSHEEIAELMQQPSATIRQRYRRALLKLHEFLNEEQHD